MSPLQRRRPYRLTETGATVLRSELATWHKLPRGCGGWRCRRDVALVVVSASMALPLRRRIPRVVEERGLSVSTAVDLARGAVDAWLHPDLGMAPAPVRAAPKPGSRPDRYDALTSRSRTVLGLAEQEAARRRSAQIGTEHLLLRSAA
jgi:hypothetical protein